MEKEWDFPSKLMTVALGASGWAAAVLKPLHHVLAPDAVHWGTFSSVSNPPATPES